MDAWLQRLVVRGPKSDVAAFAKVAAGPGEPDYQTVTPQFKTQRLSFVKLMAALPSRAVRSIEGEPQEPWDLSLYRRRHKDGTRELDFAFQLDSFECESLVVAVSRLYPRLCFVLGTIAPSVDEHSSLLAHNGRCWRWKIPTKRAEEIFKKIVPQETEENADEVDYAYYEMDWVMMDEVVDHWKSKVQDLLHRQRTLVSNRKSKRNGKRG